MRVYVSAAELFEQCTARQRGLSLDDLLLDHRVVPSRTFYEGSMKQAPTGRAVANDHLPADVLHCFTGSLSLSLFQIILKFSYRLQEPVQWKGGPSRPF